MTGVSQKGVQALAAALAQQAKTRDVIALSGDLGAGKTVFAKAFIRALTRQDEDVPSPTFTLVQTYEARQNEKELILWHFDLYRLKTAQEIYETGFEEALADGISLIEWPERAEGLLPKNRLTIQLEIPADAIDKRNVTITANGSSWVQRMEKIKTCLSVQSF
ncbi:MAG: tRNA (adenosine(37)-N6)-threonylcarbamoyltransferase complex ATPase subunit type 1 TsaE [Alphaproteobacteria bacterium]|nr:tRNA (adenosine(37)-N6)-threonylcarbamoyltransferase complex ATPase subunit type 1 TsaE [Alphaproteobacteria bacterium]